MAECCAVDPQASWVFKINKQETQMRIGKDIAQASKHSVSAVIRQNHDLLIDHPCKTGHPAFVGAVRIALGMCSGENEGVRLEMQSVRARWARVPVQVCDVGWATPGLARLPLSKGRSLNKSHSLILISAASF